MVFRRIVDGAHRPARSKPWDVDRLRRIVDGGGQACRSRLTGCRSDSAGLSIAFGQLSVGFDRLSMVFGLLPIGFVGPRNPIFRMSIAFAAM
jgi:hypothetical protein